MRKRTDAIPTLGAEEDDDDPRFVTALARGLSVLRAFRRGDRGLGNQDIAARTGLAKPTVSRLTYTLTRLGYLHYSPDTGRYGLSVSALALGFTALGAIAIRQVARPIMQELADKVGCSVALGAPDRRTMVYVEHCRGASPLHIGMEVGQHVRMASSAMGRAYIASLDDEARTRMIDQLCPDDEAGATDRAGILRALEEYALAGYVTSLREWKSEVNSVGVPLQLQTGGHYALNCGGSALVLRDEDINAVGRDLATAARRIVEALENTR